jgi:glycosyltransferase involved in cell wall biosynthesis
MRLSDDIAASNMEVERQSPPGCVGGIRFLAAIAIYQLEVNSSVSFRTLQAAAARLAPELGSIEILIYDNTPGADPRRPLGFAEHVDYFTTGRNDGLAAAFNFALARARQKKCDWLITLDQDTALPAEFLERVAKIAQEIKGEPSIAAITPRIVGDGRVLSPNWFALGAFPKWFPKGYVGVSPHRTFAFNSSSTLRVSALGQINGYSPNFWLDNSDSHLYHQLHLFGKGVFVAGDLEVGHSFSMLDKKNRMSIPRYRNILAAESAFWDISMNRLAGAERTLRLMGRWVKQCVAGDPKEFREETAVGVKKRLLTSRRQRIHRWERELESRLESRKLPPRIAGVADGATPLKISVCMASCDGERFIREQVDTVLRQLSASDELIIVDDASRDNTRTIIAEFNDDRIMLVKHESRQGIVPTFEHAIRSASGDILFLCDQDDIWPSDKVPRVMEVFCEHPDVSLVVTNLKVIDEGGAVVGGSRDDYRRFDARVLPNLFSNRFQGSTMAFRSSLIREVLPFPQGCHLLHDAWIGMRNTIAGGRCYYLNEELLLYRRHSRNASRSLSVVQKLLKRARLLMALAVRGLRDQAGATKTV